MRVIGLTGSIGMGKSTAATMLRRLRIPVHDADATVHRLMAPGGAAVGPILARFPGVGRGDGGIDRPALGRQVFANPPALRDLEAILHPRVRLAERQFLAAAARRRVARVVLDIPLLYETGGERRCDAVLVVSAPAFLQRARVLARPGMTPARLSAILAQQVPDRQKRQRTRFVVDTGLGKRVSLNQLRRFLRMAESQPQTRQSQIRAPHARPLPRYRNHRLRSG